MAAYTLPELPYSYDALEPYIDAETMEIHYTKHHKGYTDKLNNALEQYPDLQSKRLEILLQELHMLPNYLSDPIRNNGGGYINHRLFWEIMSPDCGGEPEGELAKAIHDAFGSFADFKEKFTQAAISRFGSGWAWLCVGSQGQLLITTTINQDTPISEGMHPILGLDVWEHSYYLKYQNRRPEYVEAWWNVVNWPAVADKYREALASV